MDCIICTETIRNSAALNCCPHSFCTTCILSWSKQSSTCPCCRKEIEYIIDSDCAIHYIQHVKARTPHQDYIDSQSSEDSSNSLDDFIIPDDSSDSEDSFESSSSSRDESPVRIKRSRSRARRRLIPQLTLVYSRSLRGRAMDRTVSQQLARFY